MTVISIVSQKGGSGKTTTALALGQALISKGCRVLYIDMDYQCSLTDMLGGGNPDYADVYSLLTDSSLRLPQAIIKTDYGGYIAGSQMMAHLDKTMQDFKMKESRLQRFCANIPATAYNVAIIDTPPALSLAQQMSIWASDMVIIPTQADRQHYQQLKNLMCTIEAVQKADKSPRSLRYIITRYNPRIKVNQAYFDAITEFMQAHNVEYLGTVSESSAIREAQGTDANLITDYKRTKPAKEYAAIADVIAADIPPLKINPKNMGPRLRRKRGIE